MEIKITKNPKINEVKEKIIYNLKNCGWYDVLNEYLDSDEFYEIINFLYKESVQSREFTPNLSKVFNAFVECPFDKLKCVIVGQDPYPQKGVADGIAFSCSNKMKAEKSLQYILKSIEESVKDYTSFSPDLRRWSNQGVLMYNTALTTQVNNIGAHKLIWDGFTCHLLTRISQTKVGVPFVFMGNIAKEFNLNVNNRHPKFFIPHPASAAYKGGKWEYDNIWNRVNENLIAQNKNPINW
jgi:uracil-DNA glycosylase